MTAARTSHARRKAVSGALALIVLAGCGAFSDDKMRPGLWQLERNIFYAKDGDRPEQYSDHVSSQQSCEPEIAYAPEPRKPQCRVSGIVYDGGRLASTEECRHPETFVTYEVEGSYSSDRAEAVETMIVRDHAGRFVRERRTRYRFRRLGECQPDEGR